MAVNMQLLFLSTFSGILGFSRVLTFQLTEALIRSLDFGVAKLTTGTTLKLKRASGDWTFTTTLRYKNFHFPLVCIILPHFDFLSQLFFAALVLCILRFFKTSKQIGQTIYRAPQSYKPRIKIISHLSWVGLIRLNNPAQELCFYA